MQWGDTEHLLAMAVDLLAEMTWMYATVHTEKGKPKPRRPQPVRRPTDIDTADGETGTRNLDGRQTFIAGSLSLAELDRVIAEQTGTPHGIAQEVA